MRPIRTTMLSAALLLAGAAMAAAQTTGAVTGQATDATTGEPLAGVQIQVAGTNIGGLTNQNGRYLLNRVPVGEQSIRAVLIGYAQASQNVNVTAGGTSTADFSLRTSAVAVEGLIVTATGERQRSREVGVSVGKIDVANDVELAVNRTVADVLKARSAGVSVIEAAGTTGAGSRIRIRGSASVSLNNDPLIVVDGVRASNNTGFSINVGGQDVSRLDDFKPEDIESIEVLKGPAASALYGTAAANGVIVITTKKGAAGDTRWQVYAEQGTVEEASDFPTNYNGWCSVKVAATGETYVDGNGDPIDFGFCPDSFFFQYRDAYEGDTGGALTVTRDSVQSFNPLDGDHEFNPFQTGTREKFGISASGGSERVTYYISGDYENEKGIYREVNFLENVNLRANLSSQLTDQLDVSLQTGYVTSDLRIPENDNNVLGILPSAYLGGATPESAYGFFTLPELQALNTHQNIDRLTTSFQANYRPLPWLSFNAVAGMDLVNRFDNQSVPPQRVFFGTYPEGRRTSNRIRLSTYTANLNGSAEFDLTPDIVSNTDAGVQYTESGFAGTFAFGRGLLAGCQSLACVATGFTVGETNTETRIAGAYVSQQFAYADRVFVTGTLRADDSSTFGRDLDLTTYPSVNLSWVVGEEPWFPEIGALSLLRLRAGYGEAGLQPGFRSAERFLAPQTTTIGNAVVPAFTFGGIGNPDLRPEISQEYEIGADIGLLDDRVGLELTYYDKTSKDALVNRVLAPSLGQATNQVVNLGEVSNSGFELLANVQLLATDDVAWEATVTYGTNNNELVDLGIDPTTGEPIEPIIFGLGGDSQRHQEGYPLGSYFARAITWDDANNDGVLAIDEVTLGDDPVYQGQPFPQREISISTNVTLFGWIRLSTLLDHKGGYQLFNGTEQFRCASFFNCQAAYGGFDVGNVPLNRQAAAIAEAFGDAGGSIAGFIEDADFWKLREVTATLTLPDRWAQTFGATGMSLTLAGRNLVTWTDYTGPDPEINGAGAGSNFNTFDFLSQPPVRRFSARLDLSF